MNIDYLEHLPVVLEMHFSLSERITWNIYLLFWKCIFL